MRRKATSIAVSVIVLAVMAVPLPAGGVAGFGDIDIGKFYTEPVQWMVDNGITTGTSPTCFSPGDPVTRGQAAAFMWRMEGSPTGSAAHPFTDVVASWQQDPISWMAAQGITTGTTPTTYTPDGLVTRGEVAALLHRLAGEPSAPAPIQFPDVVKPWQITPVGWMVQQGITTGTTPSTFSPDSTVSRGQIAAFFYRYKGSPAVVVNPNHPAIPVCETQVPGPSTTGTLTITLDTALIQNHNGNIVIGADNVTLDCAGHTVTGNGTGEGIKLEGRTGVTVRNCRVTGFRYGILLDSSSAATITGNRAYDNVLVGQSPEGIGILVRETSTSVLTDNHAPGNGEFGIELVNSNSNTLSRNTTDLNTTTGIELFSSDNNTLDSNRAKGNLVAGFSLSEGSSDNSWNANIAEKNGVWGFLLWDEALMNNTFTSNQALENGTFGIEDMTSGGTGDAGTDNTYTNNTCTGNGQGNSSPYGLCWG